MAAPISMSNLSVNSSGGMSRSTVIKSIVMALSAVVVGIGAYALVAVFLQPDTSLSAMASCFASQADTSFRTQCLQRVVPELLDTHTAAQIMRYITATTSPYALQTQCHPIGHIVGNFVYKKTGSIETALTECSNACRSACTHGVIGAGMLSEMGTSFETGDIAHADKEELEKLAAPYCSHGDTCHGIGHVAYIVTEDDAEALGICDKVSTGANRENCYEGVFMERAGSFQNVLYPSETEREPPTHPGDYTYPCATLNVQYQHACFIFLNGYQEPLFEADGFTTPQAKLDKATRVCKALPSYERAQCFYGIGAFSSVTFGFVQKDSAEIQTLCDRFESANDRSACTLGVISRFLFTGLQGGYAYCDAIKETDRKTLCYDALFEWKEATSQAANNPALMCGTSQECLTRYNTFMKERTTLPNYLLGEL